MIEDKLKIENSKLKNMKERTDVPAPFVFSIFNFQFSIPN